MPKPNHQIHLQKVFRFHERQLQRNRAGQWPIEATLEAKLRKREMFWGNCSGCLGLAWLGVFALLPFLLVTPQQVGEYMEDWIGGLWCLMGIFGAFLPMWIGEAIARLVRPPLEFPDNADDPFPVSDGERDYYMRVVEGVAQLSKALDGEDLRLLLTLDGMRFPLTAKQYFAIRNGQRYRAYYQQHHNTILSIEPLDHDQP